MNHINSKVVCAYSVTGIDVVPNTKEMEVAIAFVLKKDEEDNKNKEKTIEVPAEKHMQKSSNKQTVQKHLQKMAPKHHLQAHQEVIVILCKF